MTKILYIDDDKINGELVEKILEREGFVTSLATNGHDGLHLLEQEKFDLVILDYHLPEINGLEILKRLRQMDWYVDAPILILTADVYAKQMILDAGADDYMLKPIRRKALIQAVQVLLNSN